MYKAKATRSTLSPVFTGHLGSDEGEKVKDMIVGATPGERRKGRPRRRSLKDIEYWMGLQINTAARLASVRYQWR